MEGCGSVFVEGRGKRAKGKEKRRGRLRTVQIPETTSFLQNLSNCPAAILSSRASPPLLAGGGEGGTPCVYWAAGGGDLHI
jgi:hypothetical protein